MEPRKEHDMEIDLRSRVVALEQNSATRETRIGALEEWRRQHDIAEAKSSTAWDAMIKSFDDRFKSIDAKMNEISGALKFVNKLIVAGFIAALLALVWKAGIAP